MNIFYSSCIVFYLCLAEYVNKNVIKELKVSGQMTNSLITQGISKVFGGLFGGVLASVISIKYVFAVSAVTNILSVIGFFVLIRLLTPASKEIVTSDANIV
jgi:MFS transporter, PPP family, 3-phenylpropionic acid transporter